MTSLDRFCRAGGEPSPHNSARKVPRGAGCTSLADAHVLKMFQIAKKVSFVILETCMAAIHIGSFLSGVAAGYVE